MIKYIHLLNRLDEQQTLVPACERLALILSGQSDFAHSELSQGQQALLDYCRKYDYTSIDIGFPYNKGHQFASVKRAGIILATIRNILQFVGLTFSRRFRRIAARHLQPVFANASQILMISQSSGLHMLKMCLPYLAIPPGTAITVLALGPVTLGKFADARFTLITVKGDQDWVSRLLDCQAVTYQIACDHLNYCDNKDVLKIIDGILANANQN